MGRKKKLPKIEVRTAPNGYSLSIEGHKQEYFYFSPDKLLEGVMVHIGLHMTEQLDPTMIKNFIDSALEWNNLKASHKELKQAQRETERISKMYRTVARKLIDERHRVLHLCKLAQNCVAGHHSLTDALAALHARAHQDGALKEFCLKDFGITSDQITDIDDEKTDESATDGE